MSRNNSRWAHRAACAGAGAVWALAWGCGSTSSEGARFIGPNFGSPRSASIVADWNDVDAAELAVIFDVTPSPDERVFYVKDITDERGTLRIWRTSADVTPEIKLEARVGLFGEPEKEKTLLECVCARLEELKGVEWAPVE